MDISDLITNRLHTMVYGLTYTYIHIHTQIGYTNRYTNMSPKVSNIFWEKLLFKSTSASNSQEVRSGQVRSGQVSQNSLSTQIKILTLYDRSYDGRCSENNTITPLVTEYKNSHRQNRIKLRNKIPHTRNGSRSLSNRSVKRASRTPS